MTQGIGLCLLTLVASGIGTATGFGTSTIMIPVMVLILPLPTALLFVGAIHLCGDIWKVLLFRRGPAVRACLQDSSVWGVRFAGSS